MKKPRDRKCPGVLGKLIRKYRTELGLVQRELAVKVGLADTPAEISRFETGEYYVPWWMYKKLADALNIPFKEFLAHAKKDDPERVKFIESFLRDFPHLDLGKGHGEKQMQIDPALYKRLEDFTKANTADADTDAVVRVALQEYLEQAIEFGIDGKYRPLTPKGATKKPPSRSSKRLHA
jgi:transcriptional regulator with XRE-family HTH domain